MMGPVFRVIIHAILYQSLYSRDAYAAKLLDYKIVLLVELVGIEPTTSSLRTMRSPS